MTDQFVETEIEKLRSEDLLHARDETGGIVTIPLRQKTSYGYSIRQSLSRFEDGGERKLQTTEEFLPVSFDSRLPIGTVFSFANEKGALFSYIVTDRPRSATPPKGVNPEDFENGSVFVKRLTPEELLQKTGQKIEVVTKEADVLQENGFARKTLIITPSKT